MEKDKTSIAQTLEDLYPSGLIAELADAKHGELTPADAREALEVLFACDPAAAPAVREAFLAWPPERQSEAVDALAGADYGERRTWSRLLLGIVEDADGTTALA